MSKVALQDSTFVPKVVTEKPHPLRKVPGFPSEATWNAYQGRWVIIRKV